jgi:hypothetical protein
VRLNVLNEETVLVNCRGWLEKSEGNFRLFYQLLKVNGDTFYCSAKERWIVEVESSMAVSFFDNFGSFTKKDDEKGYIMDYVNPEYKRGTKVNDGKDKTSYLLKVIKRDDDGKCPDNCIAHSGDCSFNTITLRVKSKRNGVFNEPFCNEFGEVKRYTFGGKECVLSSIKQEFIEDGIIPEINARIVGETEEKPNNSKYFEYKGKMNRKYYVFWTGEAER